jgi:bud site selection protein 20
VECAKWFESQTNLVKHAKGTPPQRRVRQLKETTYSQKKFNAAVRFGTDGGRRGNVEETDMINANVDGGDVTSACQLPIFL